MGFLDRLLGRSNEEEKTMTNEKLKIGIVQGSVRVGRNGDAVAKWMI